MKKIEYPIQELVSIEMSKDKTWFVRYIEKHECFPQLRKKVKTKYGDGWRLNKKGYIDFVFQTKDFCAKNYFKLEGEGYGMVSGYLNELVSWDNKEVMGYDFPRLLFPKTQTGCVFTINWDFNRNPLPYYGNPHYKKYIEDNDGECPLPLPKDVNWWEV